MIGNDIVDLELAKIQSNWQRLGFLDKLFSEEEQKTIFSSEDRFATVWRLWSMKEAAYKAHQRSFGSNRKFNPISYNCTLISAKKGIVEKCSSKYFCSTETNTKYMYSEAFSGNGMVKWTSALKSNYTSSALKTELLNFFSKQFKKQVSKFTIKKCSQGIPRIYMGIREIPVPFSLTHHGKFSAYIVADPSMIVFDEKKQ